MAVFIGPEEVEMDYVNIPDDPTEDVQTTTPGKTPGKTPGETLKSGLRLVRVTTVSFGVLCILQATLNISLRLVSFNAHSQMTSCINLTHAMDQLQTTLNTVMKERDDLRKRLCETGGWKVFGSSCYYVSTERKTWEESRQDCQQRGAHLVIINTREEQEFLSRTLTRGTGFWIGLSDIAVEGNWTWVDGTPLTTAYWASGEPDNGVGGSGKEEDCAGISSYYPDPVTSWFDGSCGARVYWICERGI